MNAELKARWIKALRSGKYVQGRTQLRDDDKFCCLGVLCDIIDPSKWVGSRYRGNEYSALSFPPSDLSYRIGLPGGVRDKVAGMNDEGESFAVIADWIEANVTAE